MCVADCVHHVLHALRQALGRRLPRGTATVGRHGAEGCAEGPRHDVTEGGARGLSFRVSRRQLHRSVFDELREDLRRVADHGNGRLPLQASAWQQQ